MNDLHTTPVFVKIFGYQTTMAVIGFFFVAHEATAGNDVAGKRLFDAPFLQWVQEALLICRPVSSLLPVLVQQDWQLRQLEIFHPADALQKIGQVVLFREAGEL